MNPFIKRKGGKFYARKAIYPYIPREINTYIEPFVGGGSMFLGLEQAGINVTTGCYLNDLDKDIYTIWKVFFEKQQFTQLIECMKNYSLYSQDCFNYLLEFVPASDVESAFKILSLTLMSFQGCATNYYIGIGDINRKMNKIYKSESDWNEYHSYLSRMNVKISCTSYDTFFQGLFNRKESFIYADPPYFETSGYDSLPFTESDHENLCHLIHNFKGKVALSLNSHPWVLENYKDLSIYPIKTRWSGNVKSELSKSVDEVLILNYSLEDVNQNVTLKSYLK